MNLISILIPVYNHAHTIKQSLDSLLKQTYRPFEIVIVDDGSTDNFKDVIKEWIKNNPYCILNTKSTQDKESKVAQSNSNNIVDIKIVYQENSGAPAARNKAFLESVGEFIIFWDADTIAKPEMLEKMICKLENKKEASYAYSQFKFGWKVFKSSRFNSNKLKENNFIDVTSLIRRSDFIGFDKSLNRFQDWDMWLTMLEQNKIGTFVEEVLYTKIVQGRVGISSWLPSFIYKLPFSIKSVKKYNIAKNIIIKKHCLK